MDLKDYIDFEYINGPVQIDDVFDEGVKKKFEGPFYGWGILDYKNKIVHNAIETMNTLIDYINQNGPYDGILWFSMGGLMARMLMKNSDLLDYAKVLNYPIKFSIFFSVPSYFNLNPFLEKPDDYKRLHTKHDQPIIYIYGTNDHLIDRVKTCIVDEGEYTIIEHEGKHQIPRMIQPQIDPLLDFISQRYNEKFGQDIKLDFEINEEYRSQYYKDNEKIDS